MKQVRDLAYDTQDCVDLYESRFGSAPRFGAGFWASVRWLPFYLWTIGKRCQVASQVKELKARARDIGERRQRYGVTAPPQLITPHDDADVEEDAVMPDLPDPERAIRRKSTAKLIDWLNEVATAATLFLFLENSLFFLQNSDFQITTTKHRDKIIQL